MLWIDTPPPGTRPPSFSRNYTSNTAQHNHTPSLDMDLQTIPMLTALSLPGSVNSSYSCLIDPNIQYVLQTDEETWAHSPSLTPPPFSEILHKIPPTSCPPSISLSSAISNNQDEVGVSELSFPPTSQSPSPIVVPPPPENIIAPLTDAAEYATALMTSVWGGREDQIATLAPTEYRIPNFDVHRKADGAAQLGARNRTYTNNGHTTTRPTKGFMDIFKKFGTKMRKIMQGLPRSARTRLNVNVARSRISLQGHRPCPPVSIEDPAAAYFPNSQSNSESARINQCNQRRLSLPAPPGLLSRLEKPHLSTIAQKLGSPLPGRFADVVDGDLTHLPATQTPSLKPNRNKYLQSNRLEIKETRIEARPEILERMRSSRHRLSLPMKLQPSRSSSATNSTFDTMIQPRLQLVATADSP
ncbi:hypothetical protein BDZ94DRAFT_1265270 [Collybia nuda]|uniref:Uncharacterized protein n=1 Tax=Collybia nuda TaxID=64659 RepID=A0A9P5XZY6_9AGAR|nr:hypothetical protein BDZ94DRAFT_1265270 [Collybia nuda]